MLKDTQKTTELQLRAMHKLCEHFRDLGDQYVAAVCSSFSDAFSVALAV
jgi:hypothetical protein